MITFSDVSYTYPQALKPTLHHLSFALPEASFTLVVGMSGVGKSTILRCINGLVPHFTGGVLAGSILVYGLNPVIATPQVMSRHVGFVFQDPEAQCVVDQVEDEIAFALENSAMPRADMRVRVEEALDLLDLVPLRQRRMETLSGGERQRVAIAAALALHPRILVLDEPTSQLDPKSAEDVLHALERLNNDLGLTIVLAEHRLERVLAFADYVAYVHAEGIVVDTPRHIVPHMPLMPPLVTLATQRLWQPIPFTVKHGRVFAQQEMQITSTHQSTTQAPSVMVQQPAQTTIARWLSIIQRKTMRGQALDTTDTTASTHAYLQLRDVTVSYRHHVVLHHIDMHVSPGNIVVLMGRNGSGKTTLLKTIMGLVRIQHGAVLVQGNTIAGQDVVAISRQVGYLPQDPNVLLFAESVLDELLTTLRNHQLDASRDVAMHLLHKLGIAEKATMYPRDLSVGERQRVALAAMAIVEPGALLLDEPTRGLDYAAKHQLMQLLCKWRTHNMAILLITHDVEFAAAIADRVILMSQGEIIASGTPAHIMGASPLFAPQIARLFPATGWLTAEDALRGLVQHGVSHTGE